MERSISLNLLPPKRRRTFWTMQALLGVFLLIAAVNHTPRDWFTLVEGLYAAGLSVAAVLVLLFAGDHRLVVDQRGIHTEIRWGHRIELGWKDIANAELAGLHLVLQTNDGRAEDIALVNVSYAEYQEFKPKLLYVLAAHRISSQRKDAK